MNCIFLFDLFLIVCYRCWEQFRVLVPSDCLISSSGAFANSLDLVLGQLSEPWQFCFGSKPLVWCFFKFPYDPGQNRQCRLEQIMLVTWYRLPSS